MLRGIRTASTNWIGRAVMGVVLSLLVVSFGIWGIGDVFRGVTRIAVAKVGDVEITSEQFRQLYNERLQLMSRQVGRPVTSEQARAFGFDRQLLGQLVAETALDARVRAMKLGITDGEVAKRIVQDPAFRGITGQFDQSRFEQLIRQGGYTEQRFVAEQKRTALRRQLASAINSGASISETATDAFNRFDNELRDIDYVVLNTASAGEIPAPSAEALAKYYEDHKVTFRAPEYRKLILVVVTPEEVARTIEISEADAKQAFESRQARYATPEQREVQQIVFPNEEDARQAAAKVAGGTTFELVAFERGLKPGDLNLGLVPKNGIVDPAIADAAFSLADNIVSEPVKGRFGVALVRVTRIVPASTKTYADVEAEVKRDLALERAKAEVSGRRDKIEDELAGGAKLDEVAQKLKIPFRTIAAIDRSGRDPDGKPVEDVPQGANILPTAFATDIGVENDPVQVGGGYLWYEVAGITPSRERTLDEVKDLVATRWRDDEIARVLKAKAEDMMAKLKAGSSLAEVAGGLSVESAKDLRRRGQQNLPPDVVSAVFKTPKEAVGSSEGKDSTDRYVFRVTDIRLPTFDRASPEAKRISDALRETLSAELLSQYVARIESDLGTTINQTALNQATGGSSQN